MKFLNNRSQDVQLAMYIMGSMWSVTASCTCNHNLSLIIVNFELKTT